MNTDNSLSLSLFAAAPAPCVCVSLRLDIACFHLDHWMVVNWLFVRSLFYLFVLCSDVLCHSFELEMFRSFSLSLSFSLTCSLWIRFLHFAHWSDSISFNISYRFTLALSFYFFQYFRRVDADLLIFHSICCGQCGIVLFNAYSIALAIYYVSVFTFLSFCFFPVDYWHS